MKKFIKWLIDIWNSIFGKKTVELEKPTKQWGGIYGGVPDRGKEDAHTKIKKKMADESRKKNRPYKHHSNGKK